MAAVVSGGHASLRDRDPGARAFVAEQRPGFADCAPSGRVRLDALARWIQDVAYADVADAGLERVAVWVVRRARVRVNRFPRFGERFRLTTFCSGVGRMWAERRTNVVADASGASSSRNGRRVGRAPVPDVEAVALWVHLDPEKGRPTPLTDAELDAYSGVEPLRRVTARLRHPSPPEVPDGMPWQFRATECDIAGHVNNAAYWEPLEEELLSGGFEPHQLDAEIEFRVPAQPGPKRVIAEGDRRWIVDEDGELHASIVLLEATARPGARAEMAAISDGA
ncbi:MAG: acyl-ACP thioesterase domain-containing protein [Solirubrobacteraceae bacterium]